MVVTMSRRRSSIRYSMDDWDGSITASSASAHAAADTGSPFISARRSFASQPTEWSATPAGVMMVFPAAVGMRSGTSRRAAGSPEW